MFDLKDKILSFLSWRRLLTVSVEQSYIAIETST